MSKKILILMLALALIAGIAIPALASSAVTPEETCCETPDHVQVRWDIVGFDDGRTAKCLFGNSQCAGDYWLIEKEETSCANCGHVESSYVISVGYSCSALDKAKRGYASDKTNTLVTTDYVNLEKVICD